MSEQELWNDFFSTGAIESYLKICEARREGEEDPNEVQH